MVSLGEFLRNARIRADLKQVEVEKKTGINHKSLSNWENNVSKPSADDLITLSNLYSTTVDSLVGQKEMTPRIPRGANVFPLTGMRRAPILGSVRCGVGGLATQESGEYIIIDDFYKNPSEIVGFRATGDSMEGDNIHDGDICLVRLMNDVEDGAIAVVVIDGEEGTLKRVRKQPNMIILEASNSAYPPRVFAGADANMVRIVGRVIEVRQKK